MNVTLLLLLLATASPAPRKTVTLDVKDEEIRVILKSMQKQCGIKNLILDKEVQGSGTFMFRALPCKTAFDTVFKTMSLRAVTYGSDVVNVAPRNK